MVINIANLYKNTKLFTYLTTIIAQTRMIGFASREESKILHTLKFFKQFATKDIQQKRAEETFARSLTATLK